MAYIREKSVVSQNQINNILIKNDKVKKHF